MHVSNFFYKQTLQNKNTDDDHKLPYVMIVTTHYVDKTKKQLKIRFPENKNTITI